MGRTPLPGVGQSSLGVRVASAQGRPGGVHPSRQLASRPANATSSPVTGMALRVSSAPLEPCPGGKLPAGAERAQGLGTCRLDSDPSPEPRRRRPLSAAPACACAAGWRALPGDGSRWPGGRQQTEARGGSSRSSAGGPRDTQAPGRWALEQGRGQRRAPRESPELLTVPPGRTLRCAAETQTRRGPAQDRRRSSPRGTEGRRVASGKGRTGPGLRAVAGSTVQGRMIHGEGGGGADPEARSRAAGLSGDGGQRAPEPRGRRLLRV